MTAPTLRRWLPSFLLLAFLLLTAWIYGPGLSGTWLFDDYPNIVDNRGVQPTEASVPALVRAALSSPSSDFKRPLASLSFAANYLVSGLDPQAMKATNLVIHLLNGVLLFWLTRLLLRPLRGLGTEPEERRASLLAALITGAWLVLPINLTGVLYIVQRMESMANLFVLAGLIGYVGARRRMLAGRSGLGLALLSLIVPTGLGLLAKETAVLLPLYALVIEWAVFRFEAPSPRNPHRPKDWRIYTLFALVLLAPLIVGLAWQLPKLLRPESWATRDFTMGTRLLSEARIVLDYIAWTLLPLPHELSFYHDDFVVSSGWLHPWTTLPSLIGIAVLVALPLALRRRWPLAALGLGLYLAAHTLTATILPLELIYEHRNYFASYGLLLAVVPPLAALAHGLHAPARIWLERGLLAALALLWIGETATSAYAWGNQLRLAQELAARSPDSPRSQYELGRTYIIYSHYDPGSVYTRLAYAPLERAAALPESSILPQQALIFMNSRMGLPLKDEWWDSMIAKLAARPLGVQDESSLIALVQCAREKHCDLSKPRMKAAFEASLLHPHPSPRLLYTYGDYAWNVLSERELGQQLTEAAVQGAPSEPAYRVTLIRMLASFGKYEQAAWHLKTLEHLNIGGRLNGEIRSARSLLAGHT